MTVQITIRNDEKPGGKKLRLVPVNNDTNYKQDDGFHVTVNPGATVIVSVHDKKSYLLEELK